MREIKDFKKLGGRTIRCVQVHSDKVLIAFTDDTFAAIEATTDWDSVVIDIGEFSHHEWSEEDLTSVFGVDQVNEWKREDEAKRANREAANKALRRQQYESLKAEFEG